MTVTETQPPTLGGNPEIRTYSKIAEAIAAVQRELPVVGKDQTAKVTSDKGSYSYSYADLTAVSRAIYPRLADHGLAFTTLPTMANNRFVLRYLLLHTSGEYLDGEFPLPADSKTPQAMGSAITYARRYCLCAVTGVAPEDDDGAAATYSQQQRTVEPVDNDQAQAIGAVQGVWQMQYGPWTDKAAVEAGEAFAKWSGGQDVRSAPPARLRAFAAYLATLPEAEAGGEPPGSQLAAPEDDPLGPRRRKMFALFKEVHLTERQAQLDWITEKLGRTIKSRGELEEADYDLLLKRLQEGDVPAVEVDDSPRMIGRGDLRALGGLFKQIGVEDPADRLHIASSLVGRTPLKGDHPAAEGLTAAEGKTLLAVLADCKTRDDVEALIRQVEQERAQGGEQ